MSKRMIEQFLDEMRKQHGDDIRGIALPDGTRDYVRERLQRGDVDTLLFMLQLAYLMGLQTGYAVGDLEDNLEDDEDEAPYTSGPLQA